MPSAGRAFSPLDEELALWPGAFSPSIVEGAVRLGTWVPFERLPEFVRLFTGARLSASTIQRLTETAGAAYVAVQTAEVARLERDCPPPPSGPAVQQVSVDGAMVPLRGKGAWAEVKTLAIGTVDTATAQPPVLNRQGEPEVHVEQLSYFSRMTDHATFTRLATVETHRRGTETAGVVAGVVDGAEWCQSFLDMHRPDAVRILDFSHAAGYLAQIAQTAFGDGTTVATGWLEAQRHALKHESPTVVLAAIRQVQGLVAQRDDLPALEVVTKSLAYLEKREDQLRYATFQQQGYPIGSGIVESANKLVVEARLKGAGMHWAPEHVNPLLALRTVACADRWADAWPQIVYQIRTQQRTTATARRAARPPRPCAITTPPAPTVPPPLPATTPPPRAPLSYGPGRPAPNHPWKRRFIVPSRRALAAHCSDAKS